MKKIVRHFLSTDYQKSQLEAPALGKKKPFWSFICFLQGL
jgi:hypothetical protein